MLQGEGNLSFFRMQSASLLKLQVLDLKLEVTKAVQTTAAATKSISLLTEIPS